MTRNLFIRGTTAIFVIINIRDASHLVKCTPDAIVGLRIVLIVLRMDLSKVMCSGLVSLLSDTKENLYCPRCMCEGEVVMFSYYFRKPEVIPSIDM